MSPTPLSLEYLIRSSSLSGNPPLAILLHGYGSNEEDLFSFASELPEELLVISARAPYNLEMFGHAWYAINFDAEQGKWSNDAQAVESREKIVKFIDEVVETYNADSGNVTLIGFSQGTILGYAVALSYPEKIKNVVGLSGYINTGILKEGYEENDFSELNIYASHGQVDQVIPLEWAQRTPSFLENLGIEHVYEEFPVGHGVAPQNFYAFRKWLENRI